MSRHIEKKAYLLPKRLSQFGGLVAFVALYASFVRLGQSLALPIPPGNITAVWPPSGISLASVLLVGYRLWPGILLGEIVGNPWHFDLTNLSVFARQIAVGVSTLTGATLEPLLGAFLLQRLSGSRYPFNCSHDVIKFVFVVMLSTVTNATLGVTSLCIGRITPWRDYSSVWWTWWIGNVVGIAVFTPVILAWSQLLKKVKVKFQQVKQRKDFSNLPSRTQHKFTEALLLLVLMFAIARVAFGKGYPIEYMLLPCLVWAAFRFGQVGAATSIFIVSGFAIWSTS